METDLQLGGVTMPSSLSRGCVSVALALGAVCATAPAQPEAGLQQARRVIATRGSRFRIDGVPDEASWRSGQWYSGFTGVSSSRATAVQTRFAVRFDDSFLYLAAIADEPNVGAIRREAKVRDGGIFRDDCLEFMIDPTGDRVEYYHFAVSAGGAMYDSQCRQGGHVASKEWNSTARAAAAMRADGFSVELAIPFVELGLAPRSATRDWAIQVARERQAGGALELSAYMPFGGSFHVPSTYAPLALEGASPQRFLWEVKMPLEDLVTREGDELVYQFKALVTNGTGRFRFTTLRARLRGPDGTTAAELTGGHDDGQQQSYICRVPFPRAGSYMLELSIADRRAAEIPLAVRSQVVQLAYSPLKLTLTQPFYRNSIYATEDLDAISATVDLGLPVARLRGTRLLGRLFPEDDSTGRPLAEGKVRTDSNRAELSLPLPELAPGRYVLRVSARVEDGEEFLAEAPIRKLPRVAHEWRLDKNLVLLRNGEPFFPYGWFSVPAAEGAILGQEGVTAVQNYNAQWYPPEKTLEWLDGLEEQGLFGTFYPWPGNAFMKNFRQPVSAAEEAALRERVRAFRDHPALFAYYMWDEPELRPMLVERSDRLYEIVAEEDPYHPCIMLNDTIPGIHEYRNGGDILMPDPYPLFHQGSLAGRPIEYTSKFMLACREASRGKKAWWVTPQAFDYYMNKQNSRPPNLTELRNQQLQAIINGARGILWYTYSHRYNYEELDFGVPFVGREAAALRDALLAPEQRDRVSWEAEEKHHIQATVRLAGGHTYLFAVNTRTTAQDVAFTLRDRGVKELFVVSEGRSVTVAEGSFRDRFEPYGGHIYTTDRAAARGPTLEDTERAIAAARAKRAKPGNLAYGGRGTSVTVSSKSPYSGRLSMVVDGKVKGKGWSDKTWKQWPDWIQVSFPQPVRVGRIIVYTKSIREYEIWLEEQGKLTKAAEGLRTDDDPIRVTFEPRNARAVRVVSTGGDGTGSSVSEIEVYAK